MPTNFPTAVDVLTDTFTDTTQEFGVHAPHHNNLADAVMALEAQALTPTVRRQLAQGATVASANNLTLGLDGNFFPISGTTQINLIDDTGWQSASEITLYFQGVVTVKNGYPLSGGFRPMYLAGGVDFLSAPNSTLTLALSNNYWFEIARAQANHVAADLDSVQALVNKAITLAGRLQQAQGAAVATAANLTLGTDGNVFVLSGSTPINLIDSTGWQQGSVIVLNAGGGAQTIHNGVAASGAFKTLNLAGSVDFAMGGTSTLTLQYISGGWYEIARAYSNHVMADLDSAQAFVNKSLQAAGRIQAAQGANVASANNLTVGNDGNIFYISGSVQVNLLDTTGWQNGSIVTLAFLNGLTVKNLFANSGSFHGFLLAGAVDFVAGVNASLTVQAFETVWKEIARSDPNHVNADLDSTQALANKAVTATGRVQEAQGANVASAANMTLGTDGNSFMITGTTTINLIDDTGWQNGAVVTLYFSNTMVVTNNVAASGAFRSINLNAAVNFNAINGYSLTLRLINLTWVEIGRKV